MKAPLLFSMLLLSFLFPKQTLFSQIQDVKIFLDQCPTSDPLIDTILKDFQIRVDNRVITDFPCTEPVSAMDVVDYTQPLIYLQTLRLAYYMDRNMTGHLPWTDTTLYVWLKQNVDGIKVKTDQASGGYCCDFDDGKLLIVVDNALESNRNFDKKWQGISGNLGFVCHEARHLDGAYYHSDCCPAGSCDSTYDESDLSCFGVQYWLEKSWLSGFINVGIRASHTSDEIVAIANWHLSSLNEQFRLRFCYNPPEVLTRYDFDNLLGTPVENIENSDLSFYPNPAKDAVHIKNQNGFKNAELTLTDISGKILRKIDDINVAPNAEYYLNISDLNAGHYMLLIRNNDQTINFRFVKD